MKWWIRHAKEGMVTRDAVDTPNFSLTEMARHSRLMSTANNLNLYAFKTTGEFVNVLELFYNEIVRANELQDKTQQIAIHCNVERQVQQNEAEYMLRT